MRRNLIWRFVAVALSAALMSGHAVAQPPFGPRTWSKERAERLARDLALTDSQKQQALALFESVERSTESLEDNLMRARKALREAIRNNAPPQQIDQLAASIGTLTGQVIAIEAKNDATFYSLLTPEQRQKYDQPDRGRGHRPGR